MGKGNRMRQLENESAYRKGRQDERADILRTWIAPIVIPLIVTLVTQYFCR